MNEYSVEMLTSAGGITGKLLLIPDKLVFEPDWLQHSETKKIPIAKIKDVRFATGKRHQRIEGLASRTCAWHALERDT